MAILPKQLTRSRWFHIAALGAVLLAAFFAHRVIRWSRYQSTIATFGQSIYRQPQQWSPEFHGATESFDAGLYQFELPTGIVQDVRLSSHTQVTFRCGALEVVPAMPAPVSPESEYELQLAAQNAMPDSLFRSLWRSSESITKNVWYLLIKSNSSDNYSYWQYENDNIRCLIRVNEDRGATTMEAWSKAFDAYMVIIFVGPGSGPGPYTDCFLQTLKFRQDATEDSYVTVLETIRDSDLQIDDQLAEFQAWWDALPTSAIVAYSGDESDLMEHFAAGGDVNEQGPTGWTAAHAAATMRSMERLQLLVEKYDADLSIRTHDGVTPLDVAIEYERDDNADYLRKWSP